MWKGLSSYRHECRISTYIYRIAVNVSIDHIRKEAGKDEKSLSDYDDSDSYEGQMQLKDGNEDVSPESAYLKKEKLEEIKRGFDLLSPEMREVLRLRDVLGYSYSEISEMLDIPDGTVKSRLIRARLTVKKYLEQRNICPASSSKVTESDENG